MSPNPFPIFTIATHEKPEQIESSIKLLIKLYLIQKKQDIAIAVVEHINAILICPGYIVDIETRCQFRRLAEHWRCLAWTMDFGLQEQKTAEQSNALTFELRQIHSRQK